MPVTRNKGLSFMFWVFKALCTHVGVCTMYAVMLLLWIRSHREASRFLSLVYTITQIKGIEIYS